MWSDSKQSDVFYIRNVSNLTLLLKNVSFPNWLGFDDFQNELLNLINLFPRFELFFQTISGFLVLHDMW